MKDKDLEYDMCTDLAYISMKFACACQFDWTFNEWIEPEKYERQINRNRGEGPLN